MSPKPAPATVPDRDKPKEQLISELDELRAQIAILRDALKNASGNSYVDGIDGDPAADKQVKIAFPDSEERYRPLFQNMLDGYACCKMLFDEHGSPVDFVYLDVNNAFGQLTGLYDVVGKKASEVIPGIKEAHPELMKIYGRVALTGQLERFEIEFTPLAIWLLISVYSTKKGYFTAVFDNITARKRAEEALMEAKSQCELYLDLMGHDINNLHQIALGYLELARDMPAGDRQALFLEKPIEVLQRGTQLIQNVRKLQKLHGDVFKTEPADVCKVLSNVHSGLEGVTSKHVLLNMNGHERCHVMANELLHDVFANLISNAIKHTGESGIVIDMDVINKNGSQYCRVMVEDNGPGIPDSFKATIFNRTLKGTNNARGMGIGLYLVKSLVDSYGGRIWVEDRVLGDYSKGARFVALLPAIEK